MSELLELIFIVNGEEVPLKLDVHEPLRAARNRALAVSQNTGRPPDDWEIRDISGTLITDLDKKIGDFGFGDGTRLFLTLQVGAGGVAPS